MVGYSVTRRVNYKCACTCTVLQMYRIYLSIFQTFGIIRRCVTHAQGVCLGKSATVLHMYVIVYTT